jgi:phenylalanyl-tRNA synthetase beta chain
MGSIFRGSQVLKPAISPQLGKRPSPKDIEAIFASIPTQGFHVAGLLVGKIENENWQGKARSFGWQDAISYVQEILNLCNLQWSVARSDFAHAGELHPRIIAAYGLPERSAAFAVALNSLPASQLVRPNTVGTMPAALQDVALIVDEGVNAKDVEEALRKGAGPLLESITLFDRYDKIGEGKISLAFTLVFRDPTRTLTGEEVSAMRESATLMASKACGAILRTA